VGALVLFFVLFAPIVVGPLVPLFALYYGGPIGWGLLAVVVIDYIIPLSGKPWGWYCDMTCTPLAAEYNKYFSSFGLRIHPEFKIDKNRRYLFCAHPHGVFGCYIVVVMEHLSRQGLHMVAFAAPVLTLLPLTRRHFSWIGMAAADKSSMRKMGKAEYPNNVYWSTPGGIEEAFYVPDPDEQIVVEKRKGMCKIALECGTDLVPVYGFGNNQMFPVLSGRKSLLAKLSKTLNVTVMTWAGRFGIPFSFVPTKHPQLVAVGKPIPVEQCEKPSQEQIDELHGKYSVAIRELFDKHKTDPVLEKTGFAQRRLLFENDK